MEMAELGAANYIKKTTPGKDSMSQREAYREFGKARVMRWDKSRLLTSVRNGTTANSKIIYSKAELMSLDKAEKINQSINRI